MKPLAMGFAALLLGLTPLAGRTTPQTPRRNVIIFVADGLRPGSITAQETPALWAIRTEGVHFENSHSVYPTFTTANAATIATGHQPGDTGDFSNTIWTGFATFDTGNFDSAPGTPVPFIENDRILSDLSDHFSGNYLGEDTLLALARAHGYNTAAIGKVGPTAVQDAAAIAPVNRNFPAPPDTTFVDDATGSPAGPTVPPQLIADLLKGYYPFEAPARTNGYGATSQYNNGYGGDRTRPGTLAANIVQQQWLADVATKRVLPWFAQQSDKPFVLVFWSRDPDGTQHNQGDSRFALYPGINGETSRAAVRNADRNFQQLMAWLEAQPSIKANTDVIVTSDHGFATVSRREVDRTGRATASPSATHDYVDATGHPDSVTGTLPLGFLAIDLARAMEMNLFDPDQRVEGSRLFKKLRIDDVTTAWEHPLNGNGLLGGEVLEPSGSDARVIVAANGGSDLVYVPDHRAEIVARVVDVLWTLDYVGAVFVDDEYGAIPGALPLSAIQFVGASKMPRPAIVVAFKTFYLNPSDLQTAIQISDTGLQEGQGMHGGFGRDQTFNNMAAIGPDFKKRFTDAAPVGNADIMPTVAQIMGLTTRPRGTLAGRVLSEALTGGPAPEAPAVQTQRATPVNGQQTLLVFQTFDGRRYLDAACLATANQTACR